VEDSSCGGSFTLSRAFHFPFALRTQAWPLIPMSQYRAIRLHTRHRFPREHLLSADSSATAHIAKPPRAWFSGILQYRQANRALYGTRFRNPRFENVYHRHITRERFDGEVKASPGGERGSPWSSKIYKPRERSTAANCSTLSSRTYAIDTSLASDWTVRSQ